MIKVNLKVQAQGASSSGAFLGGIDISKVNWKFLILSLLYLFIAPPVVTHWLEGERNAVQKKIDKLTADKNSYNKQITELAELEEKIKKMVEEENKFKGRMTVLTNLLINKKNPMKVLYYIAQNIPDSLWLTKLQISGNKLTLEGEALDYQSIGLFVDKLNQSIYFPNKVKLEDYKTKQNNDTTVRLEEYTIKADIETYTDEKNGNG